MPLYFVRYAATWHCIAGTNCDLTRYSAVRIQSQIARGAPQNTVASQKWCPPGSAGNAQPAAQWIKPKSANELSGVQHGVLQQRHCLRERPQSQSVPTNPSPRQTAVGVMEPRSSRGRCSRASPTDRTDIDAVCSRINRPRKPHDNQTVPSQRQLERYRFMLACCDEPLSVCCCVDCCQSIG